ncbi:hypothetical protein FWK45_02350 [Histophilus somni]|uniref:Uncharacterized protein n=4 Tax=Histophilus somni TaxID=731 RepID=A0AAX2S1Q9_HISSO|nr:hypothetical protein [Histophilus somni]QEH09322.1 hypothetical protein FWK43_07440 [Histophilus somni]QEH12022.1 hypothetical protein FWK44_02345 [Histophilus somni]QEH25598.1 hypothetical protein FWK61_07465 [Histophilus somni]QEH26500.1 hypothetical protein FWK62_02355 [Histophilus somni]QEH50694.1 hypothetical protein FWK45_02350 [Histophilus somni]
MNVKGQVTVGYGFSASANFNQSKINADYASVQEQSGIYAGDEGYQINIAQHTDLKGGLITSTAQAEKQGKNQFSTGTLSYSDIQNHADYNGSAVGVGVQADINGGWDGRQVRDGSPVSRVNQGIGFGYDKDSQSSLTKSGINTQNLIIRDEQGQLAKTGKTVEQIKTEIKTDITTDNAETRSGKLENKFDKEALSKELAIQQDVTKNFAPLAAQAVAWTSEQLGAVQNYEILSARKSQVEVALSNNTNPEERVKLQGELTQLTDYLNENQTRYDLWKEGGIARAALHAAAGGLLTGNVSGAAASSTTSLAAPAIEKLGEKAEAKFGKTGKMAVNATAGLAIGAVTGNGNVGAVTAAANTDWNNRQLHPSEQQKIKELAKQLASEKGGTDAYWEERLTLIASAMVDDKENQIAKLGINAVLKDNEIYNLNDYKESLGIAYNALTAEANKNETIKWKDGTETVLYGEKVKMFQATDRQYRDSKMFGSLNYNYPNLGKTNSINSFNSLNDIGRLNGLDKTTSQRYANELLGMITEGNRTRQYSSDIVNKDYFHYVTSPKGIAEPVIWEDLLVGGGLKLGEKALSATNKALTATGETLAKSMVSNEAIALGVAAEQKFGKALESIVNVYKYTPKEYKVAFGINAITGSAVETLYYVDGSKELTSNNLASSTIKVGTNAIYDSLVHKLNPAYGVIADTIKGIAINNNNIEKSISNAAKSATSSSVINYTSSKIGLGGVSTKGISSFYNKYLDYLDDKKEDGK